jgi:hypothetical protein
MFSILLYLSAATVTGAVFGRQVVHKWARRRDLRRGTLLFWEAAAAAAAGWLVRLPTAIDPHGGGRYKDVQNRSFRSCVLG